MRKEARYSLSKTYEGFLLLDPDGFSSDPDFFGVELMELSRTGMRLKSRRPVPEGRSFTLTCIVDGQSLDLTVAGDIRWTQHEEEATIIGCSLVTPLPDSIFQEMAGELKLDMRNVRYDADVTLHGFLNYLDAQTPTRLQHLTGEGFCFMTHRMLPTAAKVSYVISQPQRVTVPARVRWRMTIPRRGYLVGCSFLNRQDAFRLRQLCDVGETGLHAQVM